MEDQTIEEINEFFKYLLKDETEFGKLFHKAGDASEKLLSAVD